MNLRSACAQVFVGLALLIVAADGAHAATVEVVQDAIRYTASPGERNELAISDVNIEIELEDNWPRRFVVVSDPGATIIADRECASIDAHRAACSFVSNVVVRLGDGDDLLLPIGPKEVHARGGPGDDRLFGGDWGSTLVGGAGADELHGGGSSDVLIDGEPDSDAARSAPSADIFDGGRGADWVSYRHRRMPVTVDLSDAAPDGAPREGDVLLRVENVHGGRGDDRLTGTDGPNAFDDEGGVNRFFAKGGRDDIAGARSSAVGCGGGADTVEGVTGSTRLAPSCEAIRYADRAYVQVTPSLTRDGMTLGFECVTSSDEEALGHRCYEGSVTVSALGVTLATGDAETTSFAQVGGDASISTADLSLTYSGRRLLARRSVLATITVDMGSAWPLVWRTRLARRR